MLVSFLAVVACNDPESKSTEIKSAEIKSSEIKTTEAKSALRLPNVQVVPLSTYERSDQAVHPDPATAPSSWGAGEGQLFITPYPFGEPRFENPSLYGRTARGDWLVPRGVTNPIARPATGHLSDPDALFNPATSEVWLYYREVTTTENEILLIRGSSSSNWSPPQLLFKGPRHTIVSPTVVRRGAGDWLMWSVNGGVGCQGAAATVELRRSTDGLKWSNPIATDLKESGAFAWHVDVEWIPHLSEFWAAYNIKIPGSCTTASLHFATSTDGVHWAKSLGPVLQREVIPEFKDMVYRGSLDYDVASDIVTLWYSGARNEINDGTGTRYIWRIGTEQLTRTALFARVSQVPLAIMGVTTAPPLTDADAP